MNYRHFMIAASLLALCACSSNTVKDTLGINRSSPDEFRVVSRPPLSVPPQFVLQPPSTSATSPTQPAAADQAHSLMFGNPATVKASDAKGNGAESQFLKNAGADHADPKVRDKLVNERMEVQDQQESSDWWDIFSSDTPKKEPVVNANKESQRIQKNEEQGKPVTEGATPDVKPRDTGLLGSIFGY